MIGATRQIQITVRASNQPALLSRLMASAVSCGAEVLVASSHWDGSGTVVRVVTQDAARTGRALTAAGFDCEVDFVVLVEAPDKPGTAARLVDRLTAAGIHVLLSYSFRSDNRRSYVVLKTSDDDRAIYLLEVDALIHQLAETHRRLPPAEDEMVEDFLVGRTA
ncbi:MAG TPA: hypothetical protein VMV72_18080 [Verrucomicrobiae bacterium]|nr:hypothetical protein [Verrucomicrobiae bacterium]